MSGNDLYCDSVISVLIIVGYDLALICAMLPVVIHRDRFLLFVVGVLTSGGRFEGSVASEHAYTYSR